MAAAVHEGESSPSASNKWGHLCAAVACEPSSHRITWVVIRAVSTIVVDPIFDPCVGAAKFKTIDFLLLPRCTEFQLQTNEQNLPTLAKVIENRFEFLSAAGAFFFVYT